MKTVKKILAILLTVSALSADVRPDQIKIPTDVKNEIRERAHHEWPEDYSMQAYEIEKQVEAYRQIYAWARNNSSNELAESLFRRAQEDWPDDYSMQWYQVEKEVAALRKIYEDEK